MVGPMARFPASDLISLLAATPRYELAESTGPDLRLGELLDLSGPLPWTDLPLSYGTSQGDLRLRQAIADRYGVAADQVVTTVGGMHALFLLAFILCDREAEAVTTAPVFPLARMALEAVGAKVRTLPLSFDRGYQPDLAELRALLSPRTRLVSLASPQNPSGVALAPDLLRELLGLMESVCPDAHLLLDETYREASYGDAPPAPSGVALSPKVISVASLSKSHGAPGLRVGWAVTRDDALREQLVRGKFNTVISCSTLDEALGATVLEHQRRLAPGRRKHLAEGLRRVEAWVRANEAFVEWVRPDAGALCCVRLKRSAFDDDSVHGLQQALEREGVRVSPGTWFGDEPRVFRVGFGLLEIPALEAALSALTSAVRTLAGQRSTDSAEGRETKVQ